MNGSIDPLDEAERLMVILQASTQQYELDAKTKFDAIFPDWLPIIEALAADSRINSSVLIDVLDDTLPYSTRWIILNRIIDAYERLQIDTRLTALESAPRQRQAGRERLGCNVWLSYMVNGKNVSLGSDSPHNELFRLWRQLWSFETGKNADDIDDLPEPFDSFRKGARS